MKKPSHNPSALKRIQESWMGALRIPLGKGADSMRHLCDTSLLGSEHGRAAISTVKQGKRIGSEERLEIYHRQYWFRITEALREDFEGVSFILGEEIYHRLVDDYLQAIPSTCWTLKMLGKKFPEFIESHLDREKAVNQAACEMAALEWAMIESFDAADTSEEEFPGTPEEISQSAFSLAAPVRLVRASFDLSRVFQLMKSFEREAFDGLLAEKQPHYFVVYRTKCFEVRFQEVSSVEYTCLEQFAQDGILLEDAIAALPENLQQGDELVANFTGWFANWKRNGWLEIQPLKRK